MSVETPNFKFNLGVDVVLEQSGETGKVVGRADFSTQDNQYLVRYKAADGRLCECWWAEEAVSAVAAA